MAPFTLSQVALLPLDGDYIRNSSRIVLVPFNFTNPQADGWTPFHDTRSTIERLLGTIFTVLLCVWVGVYPYIPRNCGGDQSRWTKAKRLLLAVAAPDIVFLMTAGQTSSARRQVRAMRATAEAQWTIPHHAPTVDVSRSAFRFKDGAASSTATPPAANSPQRKDIQCPRVTRPTSRTPESKSDIAPRILVIVQAIWLALQMYTRATCGLPITTFELSAAATVFCTLVTSIWCVYKPADNSSLSVELKTMTPMHDSPSLQSSVKTIFPCASVATGDLTVVERLVLCLVTLSYSAAHLLAGDFDFPTGIERELWRWSALIVLVGTCCFWTFAMLPPWSQSAGGAEKGEWSLAEGSRSVVSNGEKGGLQEHGKPDFGSAWKRRVTSLAVVLYATARVYMLLESIASLRALPEGTYQTVRFTQIFRHA